MAYPTRFTFVLIPASDSSCIVEIERSTAGGLERDEAQVEAKAHLGIDLLNIVSLSLPTPGAGYIGVSMYCDGDGAEKGCPVNGRASRLAQACGHTDASIHGACPVCVHAVLSCPCHN